MTPEQWEAFLQVHHGLPREGPGAPEDVHWTIDRLRLGGALDVFDAACGPGDDLVTLANALPDARITGVDKTEQFIATAVGRIQHFGPRVTARVGDMAAPDGAYDFIWCAGALYFLGVTDGLHGWRAHLKSGGHVAFSEPVALGTLSAAARAFWDEYPQITDLAGIESRVRAAGYDVLEHRLIVGDPWRAYYDPMQARIDALRAQDVSPAVQSAIAENQQEIDRWSAVPDEIAYALLIVAPA